MAYGEVLARNVRGIRSRKGLPQARLATRMQALGYKAWFTQTVGKVERGDRRITVDEILGLALALEVTMRRLLEPQPDDKSVVLPNGEPFGERTIRMLVAEVNDHAIYWQGDVPVRRDAGAWWRGDENAPDAVKAAWAREDED